MIALLTLPASLCAFLLAATSHSRSLTPSLLKPIPDELYGLPRGNGQQPLRAVKENAVFPSYRTSIPPPRHVNVLEHFDARENSVGVLFTTANKEAPALHLWMPLGKKVFTRDSPILPLHPLTARITTLINTTPSLATPEQLDRIQCEVWTTPGVVVSGSGAGVPEKWKVSFSRHDELIHFARVGEEKFWLGGKEVESYECHT